MWPGCLWRSPSFGSGMRRHQQVASQLTSATANWLTASSQKAERRQPPGRHSGSQGLGQQPPPIARDQHDPAQVDRRGKRPADRHSAIRRRNGALRPPLEIRQALVDQVEADVPARWPAPPAGRRPRHAPARRPCAPPHPRPGGSSWRSLRWRGDSDRGWQNPSGHRRRPDPRAGPLDDAHGLDKLAPVHRAEHPQAADAVADRDLIGGLLLVLGLHQVLDRQARFGESLLDPGQRQGQSRTPPLQAARQLGDEGADHRRTGTRHVGDHQDQAASDPARQSRSSGPPRNRPDFVRPTRRRCAPRRAGDSRSAPAAA
jgi:hypothetical protein